MQFYCYECEEHMEIVEWDDYPECVKCGESVVCSDAKDVIFEVDQESLDEDYGTGPMIWITDRWFYEKYGHWDDQYRGGPWLDVLNNKGPDGTGVFGNAAEALFDYSLGGDSLDAGKIEDAVKTLKEAGCIPVEDLKPKEEAE